MEQYTVGFIFNEDLSKILLIHPNRPEWQVGKLNGPGGKVEEDETPVDCVVREIEEETSLIIPSDKWTLTAVEHHTDMQVHFFTATYSGDLDEIKQLTDEKIEWFSITPLPEKVLPNLRWLIPLSIDILERKVIKNLRYDMVTSQAKL